jgi:hypothetical protein
MLVKVGNTNVDVRVEAVLSVPRLGFMDNFFTWAQALTPLGIRPTKVTGAFWGQCLQRVMEQFVDDAEYLLTIDYDTFFSQADVEHLIALAMTFSVRRRNRTADQTRRRPADADAQRNDGKPAGRR